MPEVIFSGSEGRLEGRYHHAKRDDKRQSHAPIALILHPQSLHGGTMNNRIVQMLYRSFQRRGFSVLRFNFRGVGRSQGSFDNGHGELSDAASALDWLQSLNPGAPSCWIAGYSFGSWVGMQLMMRRPEINGFVAVAPPADVYDFSFLAPCPASGLMVNGSRDDVVAPQAVTKLVHKLSHQKSATITHKELPGADHFFGQHMDELAKCIDDYLDAALQAEE